MIEDSLLSHKSFSILCFLSLHAQVIAEFLSAEEVAGMKEAFDQMDTGKKGKINLGELKIGLQKLGHQIPDADLQILMEAVSILMPFFSPGLIFLYFKGLNISYKSSY